MEKRKSAKKNSKTPKREVDDLDYLKDYSADFPNLLEYDLQAIYKKDGLQFDERWQERMLQRYQLLKCQREKRQSSASTKREKLQNEKKYKILSHTPELLYPETRMWYEDHKVLTNHLLNSSLISGNHGDLHPQHLDPPPYALLPLATMETEPPPPPSVVEGLQQRPISPEPKIMADDGMIEFPSKYRFSLRTIHDDGASPINQQASSLSASRPNTACSSYVPQSHHSVNSKSVQDRLHRRPRSSCSIPCKTKYILIKSNTPAKTSTQAPSPTKLEEVLLRQRFPLQHLALMKSLGISSNSSDTKWQEEKRKKSSDFRPKSAKSQIHELMSKSLPQNNARSHSAKNRCYFSLDNF